MAEDGGGVMGDLIDFSSIPNGRLRYPVKWLRHCALRLGGRRLVARMIAGKPSEWIAAIPMTGEMARDEFDAMRARDDHR